MEAILFFKEQNSTLLHWVAWHNKAEAARYILDSGGGKHMETRNSWDGTPLHITCWSIVHVLLETKAGRAILKATASDGNMPLHSASFGGHSSVIQMILETEEGRKSIQHKNHAGHTPLHAACSRGHTSVVQLFLQMCDARRFIQEKDNNGYTV